MKYELNQLRQLESLLGLVTASADAMNIPAWQVYFTVADVQRHLGITRYYAKKLVKALREQNVIYQEKLRYRLCVESNLLKLMVKASQ